MDESKIILDMYWNDELEIGKKIENYKQQIIINKYLRIMFIN